MFFFPSFSENLSVSYACPASYLSRSFHVFLDVFFLFYSSKKIASHLCCVTILVSLLMPIHLHTHKKRASIFFTLPSSGTALERTLTFFFLSIFFFYSLREIMFTLNFAEVVLVCINHTRIIFIFIYFYIFLLFKKNYVHLRFCWRCF